MEVAHLCPTLSNLMDRLLCPWNTPGKNTGVGSQSLLKGIFPTQESNSVLPHCRQILYHLNYQGSLLEPNKPFLAISYPLHIHMDAQEERIRSSGCMGLVSPYCLHFSEDKNAEVYIYHTLFSICASGRCAWAAMRGLTSRDRCQFVGLMQEVEV